MGLIKAITDSAFSYIGDLWEDYIYCDSLDSDTLVKKGKARRSGGGGNRADENVITDGSRIAVNPGQTLIIVEDGRIIDFTAEEGGYEYQNGTQPSMFCGSFGESLKISFKSIQKRFAFGGLPGCDQRVYFVNTKEIMNNRFGFGNVPYRDGEFDLTVLLQGFGIYSFRITDPIRFYTNVCGNVSDSFSNSAIQSQLKTELQNAMLPVLGRLAENGVRYDEVPRRTEEILSLLREQLNNRWYNDRGIEIHTMAFSSILPDDESIEKIRELQESRVYSGNRMMLGARVGAAQANAMESAAENPSGAVNGFMGMGMAQQSGGVNVSELMKEPPKQVSRDTDEDNWTCVCGMLNTMAFCPKCGSKRPEALKCSSCGYTFPENASEYAFCPKCGQKLNK